MLPHHAETEDDYRSAADKERRRTLERLREKRMEEKKRKQEEYRRKAAERRARKNIPQMEKERSDKLHELWEEEKKKPGNANLDYDQFAEQYEGDPLSSNRSEVLQ